MANRKPERGRIILAEGPDPQGRNWKVRPWVIISRNDCIEEGKPFYCLGITTTLPRKITSEYVLLPHKQYGHPRTGLNERGAAHAGWDRQFLESDIIDYIGRADEGEMKAIVKAVVNYEKPSTQS